MNRFLILLTVLLAAPAFAGTKAYTKNGEGGQIVLTDTAAGLLANPQMRQAYLGEVD